MTGLLTGFLLRQRLTAVKPYLRGAVLDLGCGGADLVNCLKTDQTYTGVDWRAATIAQLRARYSQHAFFQRDLDQDRLDMPGRYDTVVLLAVIEHLRQPEHLFAQILDVLRPGGQVVMTSPSGWGNWLHGWGARAALFSREAAHEHHQIFSRRSLASLVRRYGLSLAEYRAFLLGGNQLFVCRALDVTLL